MRIEHDEQWTMNPGLALAFELIEAAHAAVLKRSGLPNSLVVVGESITLAVITPASEGGAVKTSSG